MCQAAEACKAAGAGSVEVMEMDAGNKDSVTALAKAVEGKVLPQLFACPFVSKCYES